MSSNNPAPSGSVPKRKQDPYALKPPKHCRICGDPLPYRRQKLGKTTCLDCQADLDLTEPPQRTIVPLHKSNYIPVTDMETLTQLNPKRTT